MITVEEAKAHLRVTHNHEDAYIAGLIAAAEQHAAIYLGAILPDPLPDPVRAAVLLLVADLYDNRARQLRGPKMENTAYALLLNPYRSMAVEP